MLRGFYNCSDGSARELSLMHRLEAGEGELLVCGPLALAWDGAMPVSYAEVGAITTVLLGRLYEGADLPDELTAGASSAAEVVGRAYRGMGTEALTRLRGRYAVVVWDNDRHQGVLASDLLAVQPLFLRRGVGWLAFAGELRDLLDLLPSRPGPDPGGVAHWLGSAAAPRSGLTPFEGVTRLRPGHLVELEGRSAETRRYWTPHYRGTAKGSRADHADGLREVIENAVRRRMSDTSTAVVLSGGLDSSIVAAAATQVRAPGSKLQTYSTVFPDYPELDEGWKVRTLTSSLGIEPAAFELEPRGALWLGLQHAKRWALPLPGAGALVEVPMVAEAVRDGAEYVLDGQTGDETLGFAPYLVSDRLRRGRLLAALELSRQWPIGRPTTRKEKAFVFKNLGLKGALPYGREDRSKRQGPPWLLPEIRRRYVEMEDAWAWKTGLPGPRWWRYLNDFVVDMPHRIFRLDYLRHRATAVGAVSESPLFDFDVVDYCLRLPPELAFSQDFTRPLAREAMRGLVPDDVRLNDEKANFSMFCFDTLTGADAPAIERLLTAPDAELGAYVDMEWIRRRWRERPPRGLESTMVWGSQIWAFAAAECWLRTQADPDFVDEMLDRGDVHPPSVREAVPDATGTFSRLAGAERRVYGFSRLHSRPIQEPHV